MAEKTKEGLQRGLKERHIQLMAIGTAIGVGLFLGSSPAIQLTGPSIILGYMVCGLIVFIVMRALGELSVHNPVSGSFARHARDYIGPWAGFMASWNYLYMIWAVCTAEIIAAPIFMQFWLPDTPRLLWSFLAFALIVGMNFMAVRHFGELEFWFAMIKIIAIVGMIFFGGLIIFVGIGQFSEPVGISHLWDTGGFFPKGASGFLMALPFCIYAYGGSEMIGNTAGEVQNPEKSLAKAINNIFLRILIFYVGSLFVVMCIFPWDQVGGNFGSPFVQVFHYAGIQEAAGIMNFVVLTSALSSFNSNLFAGTRMVFNLSEQHQAPQYLRKINGNGIPYRCVIVIAISLFAGVILSLFVPKDVFNAMVGAGSTSIMVTYMIILVSHHRYRRLLAAGKIKESRFRLPFYPLTTWIAAAFIAVSLVVIAYGESTRIGFCVALVLYAALTVIYFFTGMNKPVTFMESQKGCSQNEL